MKTGRRINITGSSVGDNSIRRDLRMDIIFSKVFQLITATLVICFLVIGGLVYYGGWSKSLTKTNAVSVDTLTSDIHIPNQNASNTATVSSSQSLRFNKSLQNLWYRLVSTISTLIYGDMVIVEAQP
jgi:hypothetical protein